MTEQQDLEAAIGGSLSGDQSQVDNALRLAEQRDLEAEIGGSLAGDQSALDNSLDQDISGKPFRFNPSLHNTLLHRRVDFGSLAPNRARVYDEDGIGRNWTAENAGEFGKKFAQYRLGRIIQDNTAVAFAATGEYRWGFRFLYNPTALTVASSRNDSLVLDGRSQFNIALSGINQNYQSFGIELLLNRMPDVLMPANQISNNDYSPALYPGDKSQLRRRGTHYDLEFLYRICNGIVPLKDRGKTADIGVIIPVNARLILGKGMNHLGFIESVSYTDEAFSADMVPIRTRVQIQFRRNIDIAASDADKWGERFQSLLGSSESDSSSGGGGGGEEGGQFQGSRSGRSATTGKGEYERLRTFNGQILDARLVLLLEMAGERLGYNLIRYVTQGSHSTRVGASGGTHAGGGAVDLINVGWSDSEIWNVTKELRKLGLIAWDRKPSQGPWPRHIHGIDKGANNLSSQAQVQVQNWKDGLNGLVGRTPDDGPKVNIPNFVYPR